LDERTVAFNPLADSTAQTLAKGMTVTVAGYLADNSYTDPATGQTIRRTRPEAGDIAVSLRFASIRTAGRSPRCRLRCRTPTGGRQDRHDSYMPGTPALEPEQPVSSCPRFLGSQHHVALSCNGSLAIFQSGLVPGCG